MSEVLNYYKIAQLDLITKIVDEVKKKGYEIDLLTFWTWF